MCPSKWTPSVLPSTPPPYPFYLTLLFFASKPAFFFPPKIRGFFVPTPRTEPILEKLIWSLTLFRPPLWFSAFLLLRTPPWVAPLLYTDITDPPQLSPSQAPTPILMLSPPLSGKRSRKSSTLASSFPFYFSLAHGLYSSYTLFFQ